MAEPAQIRIPLARLDVAALQWGEDDKPLALLLHGFPDTPWTFRHVGPELARRGWRAVAPFARGYAPTGPAPDGCYQAGALVADVEELHRALGADGRAVLVGHDWGAVTGFLVAAHAPHMFARMVTLSVPPAPFVLLPYRSAAELFDRAGPARVAGQLRASWYIVFNQLPRVPEAVFDRLVARLWADWSPGYDATDDLAHLARALPDRAHRRAAIGYYRAIFQPWRHDNAYADEHRRLFELPRGGPPILFMSGARDGCMTAATTSRGGAALERAGAGTFRLLDGLGHFPQLEDPARVTASIADFLSA